MSRPQPHLSDEHREQLADLHREIDVIKNNHLVHIAQDIDELDTALKETKEDMNKRFDKLDDRLFLVVGLVVTTLITIVLATVFGA